MKGAKDINVPLGEQKLDKGIHQCTELLEIPGLMREIDKDIRRTLFKLNQEKTLQRYVAGTDGYKYKPFRLIY